MKPDEYKQIELHLREDQYEKVCMLTRKLPFGHDGAPDGWEVIRGILDAYFRLCDVGQQPALSSPASLSQEGSGGEARRPVLPPFVGLKQPVSLKGTTWPEGTSVVLLTQYQQLVTKVVNRQKLLVSVDMAMVRFPDGRTGKVPVKMIDLD